MHTDTMHPTGISRQQRHRWSSWRITWSVAMVMGLGVTLLSPSPVQARTFHCRAGDVACLIASIKQANVQPGQSHEIRLAAGVYTLTTVENDTDGPNGLPSITRNLTIQGAGADLTIIERSPNGAIFRLLHVAATGVLTLDGLTLQGGGEINGGIAPAPGGALLNHGGKVTISHTIIVDNASSGFTVDAGGISLSSGATATITATTFANNAAYGHGGGLMIERGATATIKDSTFVNNYSLFAGGGLFNAGILTVTNSTFAYNLAGDAQGGGISDGGTAYIFNSTIAGNDAACPKKDQLRERRVGICDIGSIEFQGTAVSSR